MSPRYRVTFTTDERNELEALTRREKTPAGNSYMLALCFSAMPVLMVQHGKLLMRQRAWCNQSFN